MDTFGALLRQAAVSHAQKIAIVAGDNQISYKELDRETDELAAALLERCHRGDRIAIRWPNSIETVKLIFACGKAGLICVPINIQLQKAEITHILRNSGAVLCFTHPEFADSTREAGRDCEALRECCIVLPHVERFRSAALLPVHPEEAVMILYTSGTTAQPKGATHTHRSLIVGARMFHCAISSDLEVTLVMTQLAFISSFVTGLLPAMSASGTVVLLPKFEAVAVLELIEARRCRYTFGLPVMAQLLIEEQERRPRKVFSLRTFIAGGDVVPVRTQDRFRKVFGFPIREAYGMTEIGPALANPASDIRAGSLGIPLEGVTARVTDVSGKAEIDNRVGELTIKSPATFLNYWDDPDATAQLLRDGWVHTGDLARRDSQGYLWFEGRIKQIIVRDGANISPQEIEEALYSHPAVFQAAVIGVPDRQASRGERVIAFISTRAGNNIEDSALCQHMAKRLASYKLPEQYVFQEQLPVGPTGKVERRTLKEAYLREMVSRAVA